MSEGMKSGEYYGLVIVAIASGLLGGIAISAMSFAFQHGTNFCDPDTANCAREWLSAISTAIAAIGAIGAVVMAIWTVKSQIESNQRSLRAYLFASEITIDDFSSAQPMIRIALRNEGATPADNIQCVVRCRVNEPNLAKPQIEKDARSSFMIGPKIANPVEVEPPPAVIEKLRCWSGSDILWTIVVIAYRDAFGHVRETVYKLKTDDGFPTTGGLLSMADDGVHWT
ncbi:hypothetical protein ACWTU6_27125 [Mesorhizobium sp. BHbsci]